MKLKPIWLALTAGGFWLLIFIGTHYPKKPGTTDNGFDKVLHFTAFGILAALLSFVLVQWLGKMRWLHVAGVVATVSLYGAFDEITQKIFTTTRKADIFDWVADTLGAITGAMIVYSLTSGSRNGGKNNGAEERN